MSHQDSLVTLQQISGWDHIYWPAIYWGSGIDAGIQYVALIQEDHTYTFQTCEQGGYTVGLPFGP